MNEEEKKFLMELRRDIDYRYQKLKEQNTDIQNKIVALNNELHYSRISIWRSIYSTIINKLRR